jgi:molybdenum cofactor cytidylyltransferase
LEHSNFDLWICLGFRVSNCGFLPNMIYALIPAAGKSVRMGQPKLALRLGGQTVLEHVIDALRQGGVDHVLVVVGPHVSELAPVAEKAGAEVLLMPQETHDMRATVERGLCRLEERYHPNSLDYWLLIPGDHPTLDPAVVRRLIQEQEKNPRYSIFIPTYRGRRGHPALIGWKHIAAIRQISAGQGLNVYLRQQDRETLEVPVGTAEALFDLDTPEDYKRLQKRWEEEETARPERNR